jgi:hypothetical protein
MNRKHRITAALVALAMTATPVAAQHYNGGGWGGGYHGGGWGGYHGGGWNRGGGGWGAGLGLGLGLGILGGALAAPYYAPAPPAPAMWYWCDATGSYYPYTPTCPSGFRAVWQ